MIDRAEVRRIAALAHLALSEDEEQRLAGELSQILAYVEQLRGLDTTGVEPTTAVASSFGGPSGPPGGLPPSDRLGGLPPHPLTSAFREDEVQPSLPPERAIANAPASAGSAVAVPKILD